MSTSGSHPQSLLRTDTLNALADSRRRRILTVLDQTSPLHERELAILVAALEVRKRPSTVDEAQVAQLRNNLRHVQLPVLDDADLVTWDRDDELVVETIERGLPDDGFTPLVDPDGDEWDHVLDCLANERRRTVLTTLRAHDGEMTIEAVARDVAAVETAQKSPVARSASGTRPSVAPKDVLISLHHIHVPKLTDAGLIEQHSNETISYQGNPELPVEQTLRLLGPG